VVVGDLLVLAEGDIVPADADVVDAAPLLVDESALTGDSAPVDKSPSPRDVVSAGTTIVRGRGMAVVSATGEASSMGRIVALMAERQGLTPLQRCLAGVGRVLAMVAVALCGIVLGMTLGVAVWGHSTGREWQSMAFFVLGATQLAVVLGSRVRPGTLANPSLLIAVAIALGLQFVVDGTLPSKRCR
jgi:magnesium-transporting ATPase (P-type)